MSKSSSTQLKSCSNPFCNNARELTVSYCQKCLKRACLNKKTKCLQPGCDQPCTGMDLKTLKSKKVPDHKKSFCQEHYRKNFVPCTNLAKGYCSFKNKCRYNHSPCKYFATSKCKLGKFCHNVHIQIQVTKPGGK